MASEAIFLPSAGSVQFAIYPDGLDGARIIARIDEEALQARFHASEECVDVDLVQAYERNADSIDALATARFRANPGVAICLHSDDFQRSGNEAERRPGKA
ncbi:hypothetical protein QTH87_08660 [Variovorax sp. J22P168]|uniref:hypothetical protein n=1 Tax=Variovorax jilinensis TaxID=3053513 RepID=UPI002574FBB8|nr:hypothetical protein [Variovorax sp. J22P168]MDM0012502.1 hypothetical protein [Variovorax sp. J22P168]